MHIMPRFKFWAFRLLAMGVGTLAALVAVELCLRIILGRSNAVLFVYRPDTLRIKLMRPNVRGLVYGQPIETNASGYRARREYGPEKPPGVRRIVVIGDSFTVSAGVPFEQIATTRLETMLSESQARPRFEVYNVAVGGHEILHHLATVKEVALGYAPDLILFLIYPYNDFDALTYDSHLKYGQALARGGIPGEELREGNTWFQGLRTVDLVRVSGSNLMWLARRIPWVDRWLGPSLHDQILASVANPSPNRERSAAALREIRETLRAAGVPAQVYLLPSNFGTYALQRPLYDAASRVIEEAGLPVRSLLDTFEATGRSPTQFRVSIIDSHPNAEYNSVVAGAIHRHLRESGLLDRLDSGQADAGDRVPPGRRGLTP